MFIANTITLCQGSKEMVSLNWPFRAWHNKLVVAWGYFFCLYRFRNIIVNLKPTLCYYLARYLPIMAFLVC